MVTTMKKGRSIPGTRVRLFLLILLAAFAAASYATDGDEPVTSGKKLRTRGITVDQEAEERKPVRAALTRVLDELDQLKSRVWSLEEENERLREDSSPRRRSLQAAPRTVSLTQFNQFKKSVTTQLATLSQSLVSTGSILDALQKTVDDKVGQIEQKATELEARVDDLETIQASLSDNLTGLASDVASGSAALAARLDSTGQGLASLTSRLACVDAASDGDELVFSGCNVNIRNGLNRTNSTNGKGNLVVGYDENESDVGIVAFGTGRTWWWWDRTTAGGASAES
jgi:chromosome segregation ATPase